MLLPSTGGRDSESNKTGPELPGGGLNNVK